MTDKLSKDELLEEAKEVFDSYLENLRDYPSEVIVKQVYQQIAAIIKNQPTITEEDIRGWATEAKDRVEGHENWAWLEDIMKDMLDDIGVSITLDHRNNKT